MPRPLERTRADTIRELSARVRSIQDRATDSPEGPHGPGYERGDLETEKRIVKHCRRAIGLLARRPRSAHELQTALSAHESDPAVIEECLARLDRAGLIDDEAFARQWIYERRTHQRRGTAALRSELCAKGVETSIIDSVLEDLDADDIGEKARCTLLVRERMSRELARGRGGDPLAIARRVSAAAQRKGYSAALARHVVSQELNAAGLTLGI